MEKYRTLFYHSKWDDKKWIDNAIAVTTQIYNLWRFIDPILWDVVKLGLSHEEIQTPDENGLFTKLISRTATEDMKCGYTGTCYTSTMGQIRGSNNVGDGTCKRHASLVLKHPERWSYVEHEVSDWRYECMIDWMEREVFANIGYGLGPYKNVCSKFSHNANVVSGELAGPFKLVSPLGDALLLVKSGKEIIPLKG